MKVSYNWLQRYFDKKLPSPEKIAEALTFHAFEIDGIEVVGKDTILDVKVLPDRAHDCFSHRGIAKEISAIMEIPLAQGSLGNDTELPLNGNRLKVGVGDRTRSPRYMATLIEDVEVGPSPEWLQDLLLAIGQRPINNIVDAANFVMFDMGQPLHAFDADKLLVKDGRFALGVRIARAGETIETLDGKTYELTEEDSVIVDSNSDTPVGIAGIKGGKAAEITTKTTAIIIESANFAHVPIRKTSGRLKLRTDASVRFEHEISAELASRGLNDVARLILELSHGTLVCFADDYPLPEGAHIVSVSADDVNKRLGINLKAAEVGTLLSRLSLQHKKDSGAFLVTVPPERLDIRHMEDLVAEVGRLFGYQHITPQIPKLEGGEEINKRFNYSEKIRAIFERDGYSEIITTTFAKTGDVRLLKPVAKDKPHLRRSLRENLLESLKLNRHNADLLGLSEVRLYEIGTVFRKEKEAYHLAWVVDGAKDNKEAMQKMLQALLDNLGLPLQSCADCIVTEGAGDCIELAIGDIIERLPEPTTHSVSELHEPVAYRPFSPYPANIRDIALFTPSAHTTAEETARLIEERAGPLLVRTRLFDEFKKGGRTSFAFRLAFQSPERTLTDAEVTRLMETVNATLAEKGYEIR